VAGFKKDYQPIFLLSYGMPVNAHTAGTFIDSGLMETFIPRAFADFDGDDDLDI